MTPELKNGKHIAENTFYLYFRMLILMLISLYTSRVVLDALGVEDYGIYYVVGGFVALFSMLSSSMSTAFGRYLAIEIGNSNYDKLSKIFSTTIVIQFVLCVIIFVFAETVGLWAVNVVLNIPSERVYAANWCYQFSLISFLVGILSVPFTAIIVAFERMAVFAYMGIFEALGKLLIAYLILISPFDRLVYYALLAVVLSFVVRMIYIIYCRKQFNYLEVKLSYNKHIFWSIFKFSGWNYLGVTSSAIRIHGLTILMNVFFDPAVNAARGLATKMEAALYQFVTNFSMAYNPQILKSYAKNDYNYLYDLICKASKLSFFLFWLISLPVLFEAESVLNIWLNQVPEYTATFFRLAILFSLIRSMSLPLITAVNATGKIKNYQILLNSVSLSLVLPVSYWLYLKGWNASWGYIVCIVVELILLSIRIWFANRKVGLPIKMFIRNVLIKVVLVGFLSFWFPFFIIRNCEVGYERLIIMTFGTLLVTMIIIGMIGVSAQERNSAVLYISKGCKKWKK